MRCEVLRSVTTRTTQNYVITAEEIRKALDLPKDAKIFVQVPGGGDWSNTDLEIDSDTPLRATVTTTTTDDGEYQ